MEVFPQQIRFGFPEEWDALLKRHPELIKRLQPLFLTLQSVFIREMKTSEEADRVIFFLGRLAVEDFMEILLLCANGYGVGAMKLLRGLYERAVTLGYIAKKPNKAEDFLDYHYIHLGKHLDHASKVFPMHEYLSQDLINEIQNGYKTVKEKYKEIICNKCGVTRTRLSWSELDILSMSREAGINKLYLQCYYEPTLQAHTTVSSLVSRFKPRDDGSLSFREGSQHKEADQSLICAHNLILYIIKVENDYFKMGLEKEIDDRFSDFQLIWKKN